MFTSTTPFCAAPFIAVLSLKMTDFICIPLMWNHGAHEISFGTRKVPHWTSLKGSKLTTDRSVTFLHFHGDENVHHHDVVEKQLQPSRAETAINTIVLPFQHRLTSPQSWGLYPLSQLLSGSTGVQD